MKNGHSNPDKALNISIQLSLGIMGERRPVAFAPGGVSCYPPAEFISIKELKCAFLSRRMSLRSGRCAQRKQMKKWKRIQKGTAGSWRVSELQAHATECLLSGHYEINLSQYTMFIYNWFKVKEMNKQIARKTKEKWKRRNYIWISTDHALFLLTIIITNIFSYLKFMAKMRKWKFKNNY